jgi:hypothetical protein
MFRARSVGVAVVVLAVIGVGVALAAAGSPAPVCACATKPPVAKLISIARGTAAGLGDPNVKSARVVVTTKRAAEEWLEPGSSALKSAGPMAYVIVVQGNFVCRLCSVPSGAKLPHGHSAQVVWVPGQGITDSGLTPRDPRALADLGRVERLDCESMSSSPRQRTPSSRSSSSRRRPRRASATCG